jgi:ESF2/ABP1 family protein
MSDEESQHEERILGHKKGKLLKEAEQYKESLEKRGVIYMSRVPPFMKPNKARNLFEQYGEVTRIFLQEEGTCNTRQYCMDGLTNA